MQIKEKSSSILKIIAICLILIPSFVSSQIVSIEPTFFTQSDDITVTYDATQGSGGLVGVPQVYMHAGLITESGGPGSWQHVQGNWGTDDPKVKMSYIGDNKHTISYNIEEFHGIVGQGVQVNQLAFVFRNVDGSKEGKTETNGDIFIDIPESNAFSGFFQKPTNNFLIGELGEFIEISAVFSEEAEIFLFDNDQLVHSTTGDQLNYNLEVVGSGTHLVRFEANNGSDTISESFSYVINSEVSIIDPPSNTKMGVNRISDTSAILRLYAPEKEFVYVVGNFTDWTLNTRYQMNKSVDGETFWVELNGLSPDTEYLYQYFIDGEMVIADPLSELVLDQPDGAIPEENYPNLTPFPLEHTVGQISVFKTNKEEYPWVVADFDKPNKVNLVIYEILIRDFTEAQNYQTLMDTLDYFKRLGVNAIELTPVSEFENNQSWGYNVSYHMALDKQYGTANAFKAFIDKAHENGIAIILDMVFNHAFGQSPLVRMWWDAPNNRPAANSPYFNQIAKHPFNVGFDFNHESQATINYVKQVMSHWIDEFKVDGFRFDLAKGFTQTFSATPEEMSVYDPQRISTLLDYGDHCWSHDPEFYVILEHFADNTEERSLSNNGLLIWANAGYNYNEATMGYHGGGKSDFRWTDYKVRNWDFPHMVTYLESHDEERLMYKNLEYGNSSGSYDVTDFQTAISRNEMAACFFFLTPGPKMFFQFGELGYELSINQCLDGSVNENCRLAPKPIHWEYIEDQRRKGLFNIYSKLIHLKTTDELLLTPDFTIHASAPVKWMRLENEESSGIVVGNFDVEDGTVTPEFHHTGWWYDYITNDSINVTDVGMTLNLKAGEFHVYLDKKVDFTNSVGELETSKYSMKVFPNPSSGQINVGLNLEETQKIGVEIFDISGRLVQKNPIKVLNSGINIIEINMSHVLESGVYFIMVKGKSGTQVEKLIYQK